MPSEVAKVRQWRKNWYERHKEAIKEYRKEWYQRNKEEVRAKRRAYYHGNREKMKDQQRASRQRHPERAHDRALRSLHGIGRKEYQVMFQAQQERCAICGSDKPGPGTKLKHFSVDHDHKTGKIRGLLCSLCNRGLGAFGDDVARMMRAIAYLENQKPQHRRNAS